MVDETRAPGPGRLSVLGGLAREGFLAHVGTLWRRYGDTFEVRVGPRTLTFALHPDAVRDVTVTQRRDFDKVRSYDTVRRYLTGDGLVASTGPLWKRQRKLMAPFFTPRGIQAYTAAMLSDGAALARRWERLADEGRTVDMGEEMTHVTASIIVHALFGAEAEATVTGLKDQVATMIAFANSRAAVPHPPTWMPLPSNRRYLAAHRHVHAAVDGFVARRRALAEPAWPDDLLTRLLRARDPETGEPMTDGLLRDESITLFFAGHETTARTMAAAWYALDAAPAAYTRLHAELDAVLGDADPTVDDLRRLPYTLRVAKEVLRLYPPAPFYVRDALRDATVGGHPIPAGRAVMLSPYYTHRHPAFWDDPERFDPDRWEPAREAARHPGAYHPFALGERVCIGNHFSLLETHLLLALLARRFRPRLTPGHDPRWSMAGVLSPADGLPMVIERRAASVPAQ